MRLAGVVIKRVKIVSKNIFLGGLGSVAFYLVIMGWRIGKVRPPTSSVTLFDRIFVWISMVLFALFTAFGVWVIVRGNLLGAAAAGIGYLGFSSGLTHHQFFADPQGDKQTWMEHHGTTLGGAFIASATAFTAAVLTNYLKQIPEFVVWLAPIAILLPMVSKQVQRGRN